VNAACEQAGRDLAGCCQQQGGFVLLVVLIAIKVYQHQPIVSFIPVTVLDGMILVAFWLMQRFSYIEVSEDGIKIRYLLRQIMLKDQTKWDEVL